MISILLPIYNGERYLSRCLESILNQSYSNFELLIGFNGTIDKSKDIVTLYKDDRIKIFDYGQDKGKAKTLNKLLKEVKTEWVALQDDDDIWIKDKLDIQLEYTKNYDIIGTMIKYIDEYDHIIGQPNLAFDDIAIKTLSLNGINQVANTSTIFKLEDILEINGWREDIDGIEDFDLWLRLMKNNKYFINLNKYLVHHRIHRNSNFNSKSYDIKEIL